jgi:tetratricopeptide (TPR) repeat protein
MHCFQVRFSHAAGAFATALILAGATLANAQPGADKSDKSGADAGKGKAAPAAPATGDAPAGQQQVLTAKTIIGDAVGDSASPQYQDIADAVTRAINGDIGQCKEFLEAAFKKNPNLPPPPVMFARIMFAARQIPLARNELELAARDYPNDPEAYMWFAQLALQEGQVTDAELLYQKTKALSDAYSANAKRKRNFDLNVASGLAAVAERREQWDNAIAQAKKLSELDPENAAARQRMGVYIFRKGKGAKEAAMQAYEEFKAAAKLDPKSNAEITLAQLFQNSNEPAKAKTWVDFAVSNNKNNLGVLLAAAQLSAAANRLDDAKKFADDAIRVDAESGEAKLLRAGIARLAGDLPKAESILEQLNSQYPSNIPAANLRALVLVDQEDKTKRTRGLQLAEMNLKAQTEGNRTNPDLLATYGWALFRNGQTGEAEKAIAQVWNNGHRSQDYAYYLVKTILEPRGEYPKAVTVLEQILNNSAPFPYRLAASALKDELKKKPVPAPGAGQGTPIVPDINATPPAGTTPSPVPGTPGTTVPGTK